MDKTWLETEMDESKVLIRKKLEELNNTHPDDVDDDVLCQLNYCYKILLKICEIKVHMK